MLIERHLGLIARYMLQNLGYQASYVRTPAKTLDLFAVDPYQFDVVVTDMAMPQMTGPEMARKIFGIRPGMPMIICTGHNQNMGEEKAIKMGFKAFLLKPVKIKTLATAVRSVLDGEQGSPHREQ